MDQGHTGTDKAWIEHDPGGKVEVVHHPPKPLENEARLARAAMRSRSSGVAFYPNGSVSETCFRAGGQ